jgi:hypothetical protein
MVEMDDTHAVSRSVQTFDFMTGNLSRLNSKGHIKTHDDGHYLCPYEQSQSELWGLPACNLKGT